jgi:hypothetical protein
MREPVSFVRSTEQPRPLTGLSMTILALACHSSMTPGWPASGVALMSGSPLPTKATEPKT